MYAVDLLPCQRPPLQPTQAVTSLLATTTDSFAEHQITAQIGELDILGCMPTPLSAANPRPGADAWQELEEVLADIGQLARTAIAPDAFYERVLAMSVRALSAAGGCAWLCGANGALRPIAQLNWRDAEQAADVSQRFRCPVRFGLREPGDDSAPVAILEVLSRVDASPAAHRGCEQFLSAVCEIAAEYHAFRELARLRQDESYHSEIVRLSTLVHRQIELTPTAYAIANEGRRVIGCDRLSVLAAVGRNCRLLAVSGSSRVERRGIAARHLEELAELVRPTAEPAYYADGQSDALPPIADALEAHVEESQARQVAVLPLTRPASVSEESSDAITKPHSRRPVFVLVAEQFDGQTSDLSRERLLEVGQLCSTALYNALEVHELPFRWFLRPLAATKRRIADHAARSTAIAAAAAALIAALVFVPVDFTIEARGTLEPTVRNEVFAPHNGLVDEVLVADGADVAAGQPLVKLRDPTLDLELKRVHGEMETVRRQLDAVRATKSDRGIRDASATEVYRLSAGEREFEQRFTNLQRELDLLTQERDSLVVRSPIAGRVLTWDIANRLVARPVERGEVLVTVADLSADWQLQLDVPDDRIGHVLAARAEIQPDLPVRFRLRSDDELHTGNIRTIATTADAKAEEAKPAPPTVRVTAAFDKSQMTEAAQRELRPGVSTTAQIDCGRRSLGYVWLHDVWDAAIGWLRF